MVRVGEHTLEVINARIKQAVLEYTHNGETWIEGRPGEEYLFEITSHQRGTRIIL